MDSIGRVEIFKLIRRGLASSTSQVASRAADACRPMHGLDVCPEIAASLLQFAAYDTWFCGLRQAMTNALPVNVPPTAQAGYTYVR